VASDPWVCIGDFNEVLAISEKLGSNIQQINLMQAFQQTLEVCALTDLGFVGPKFTSSNCQEGIALIKEHLDRGVANLAWRNLFLKAEVVVSVSTCSDHAPLFLNLIQSTGGARHTPRFFYEASWALEEGFREVIDWRQKGSNGTSWERLGSKLEGCVTALKDWRRASRNSVQGSISKLQRRLLQLQTREDRSATSEVKKN
jgi:hypothetical protein